MNRQLVKFGFILGLAKYHVVSNVFGLNLLFLLFSTFVSLPNLDKRRSAIKLLVGKPSKSLSFSKLTSAARNVYSRPHCNLTADAADVHIIFKFLWIDCWSKQEITFHELKQHNFA